MQNVNRIIVLVAAIIILAPPLYAADPWSKQDIALEVAWETVHYIDWMQTRQIARDPEHFHEAVNPFLGEHPSLERVNTWMIGAAIAHPIVTHFLPEKWRIYWQGATIGMSVYCVGRNHGIGLHVSF